MQHIAMNTSDIITAVNLIRHECGCVPQCITGIEPCITLDRCTGAWSPIYEKLKGRLKDSEAQISEELDVLQLTTQRIDFYI